EMSFSHLSNCGVGTCYEPVFEQMHVDGNKSLVYAMINFSLLPEDTSFAVPGRVGYLFNPRVVSSSGSSTPPPTQGLPPQQAIEDVTLDPTNEYTHEFTILGPDDGVYNGGVEGKITQLNVGGIGAGSLASLVLEHLGGEETPQDGGCGVAGDDWIEVNRYFNQSSAYLQSGQAVHADSPEPGRWRICLTSTGSQLSGVARLDIGFSTEKIWPNPGQLPYSVSNMKFFADLARYMAPGQLTAVRAPDVLSGAVSLDGYSSLVVADDAFAGVPTGDEAAWGAKLRAFVESGGNLVLTDGALQGLAAMGIVPANQVARSFFYAGYIAFTSNGGGNETYADPLAANVDQPGAAEGAGHRHQTYEPVPLGMDIGSRTSCSGAQCTAPIWTVAQAAWQGAGGRTVGQSVNGRTSFGELPLGLGVVRIVGALLPMPTDRYYHPFGLANYALTYSGYQVLKNTLEWERPLPDLTLSAGDVSLSSERVVGGDQVTITATIRNVGTLAAAPVAVRFTDNGQQIGTVQTIGSIGAGGTGTAQVVWSTKHLKGERTLTVTADPANALAELDETNNAASRTVVVQGNKVKNGSFEESSSGSTPDAWSSSGDTSYSHGGSDGERSVTAGPTGGWASEPVAVEAGRSYGMSVDVAGAGGTLVVEQLSAGGLVLASLSEALRQTTGSYLTATTSFAAADGVAAVRIRLVGGLGAATFDNVRLWEG
nr:hypothetical protein [Actinomycetota bacterium]